MAEGHEGDLSPNAAPPRIGDPAADTQPLSPIEGAGGWRSRWPILVVLAWAALAAVTIVQFGIAPSPRHAGAIRATTRPRVVATAPSPPASTPAATLSPSAPPPPATQALLPISAAAYGPTGLGSGDNASNAASVIDANAGTAWQTDWYRTAAFGNLQTGTGLLIDMGRPVTITSVRIILGSTPGANLELLTGDAAAQSQMLVQASVSDVGGSVSLNMAHPEQARYLLIWLTLLPPDSSGTFQAAVYNVSVDGTP